MRTRPLIALVAAEVISSLGSLMSVVALPWFVLETTGSPGRMSAVLAAEAAPVALLARGASRAARARGSDVDVDVEAPCVGEPKTGVDARGVVRVGVQVGEPGARGEPTRQKP